MAKALPLPDGTTVAIREGETPAQTWARAQQMYPEAFGNVPEKAKPTQDTTGFKAAASAGATRLGGEFELLKGKLGVKSEAEAQKEYEAAQAKAATRFTPTEKGWTEDPFLKFKETLGGSVPSMALPAAAGLAALTLPVSGPVAAGLGLLGAGAASAGQFTASNLGAQVDTGKTLEEASLGKAVGAAIPQALIDTAAMALLPGVGKLFGSVGSKLTAEQAKAIASQTLARTAADYTAKTGVAMGREGITEVAQQVLERLQAGLEIADPAARKEYIDSFIGGAVLGGTLAPVGRAMERGGAKSQAAAEERKEKLAASAEQQRVAAEAAAKEEAFKQSPDYALKVADDYAAAEKAKADLLAQKRKIVRGSPTETADIAFNTTISKQLQAQAPELKELGAEFARLEPTIKQATEQKRVEALTPEEYSLEQMKQVAVPEGVSTTTGEQEKAAPPEEAYVADRIALAKDQTNNTADADDYANYLMTNLRMAQTIVDNQTPLPGLDRKEQNVVRGSLKLKLQDIQRQRAAAAQAGTAAGQQRVGAVESEEQAAIEEQRRADEAEATRMEAERAAAERQVKIAPEVEGIKRLGKSSEGTWSSPRADDIFRNMYQKQMDEKQVDQLLSTLPTRSISTPGQIYAGMGFEAASRRDLLTRMAIAKAHAGVEDVTQLKQELASLDSKPAENTEIASRLPGEGMAPAAEKKTVEAEKHADWQSQTLREYIRFLEDRKQGKVRGTLRTGREERVANAASEFKDAFAKSHLEEIAARLEAFGLPPLTAVEKKIAEGRVMRNLNELGERWGNAVPEKAVSGQKAFAAPVQAVEVLQEQIRSGMFKTINQAAERYNLAQRGAMEGKTKTAEGGARIGTPDELKLRAESTAPKDDMRVATETARQLRDTLDQRTYAKPELPSPKEREGSNRADMALTFGAKERGMRADIASRLTSLDENTKDFIRLADDVLPEITDPALVTNIKEELQAIAEGRKLDPRIQQDLQDFVTGQAQAAESTTRPGVTPEELQRTSAKPQKELPGFESPTSVTQRATPANFQKMLDSKDVQGMRAAIEKMRTDNEAVLAAAKQNTPAALRAAKTAKARVDYDFALAKAQKSGELLAAFKATSREELKGAYENLNELEARSAEIRKQLQHMDEVRASLSNQFDMYKLLDAQSLFKQEKGLRAQLKIADAAVRDANALVAAIDKVQAEDTAALKDTFEENKQVEKEFEAARIAKNAAQKEEFEAREVRVAVEKETSELTQFREAAQRGREGLELPGLRVTVDTTKMQKQINNIRSAMGSLDAQLNAETDPVKKADIQAKIDATAAKLETVYADAPRITTTIKEKGQLELEKAFDEVHIASFDKQMAKMRIRGGEYGPALTSRRRGALERKGQTSVAVVQAGEKKATPASEMAGSALERVAQERAALRELEDRVAFLRANGKDKAGGRLTEAFKKLQEKVAKQKTVVKQTEDAQKAVVAAVRDVNKEEREARKETGGTEGKLFPERRKGNVLFRTTTRGGPTLATDEVSRLADRITANWKNVPEIVVVATEQELPLRILGQLVKGERETVTPGLFDPKTGNVYLIASNLHNANDVALTIAHEVAGHFGLRSMLGGTYTSTMDSLYAGNPAVRKQADAKMAEDSKLSQQVAVEEVLADMAETGGVTPAEKGALRRIYDALKTWFRTQLGLPNVSDAEVRQVVTAARKYVMEGGEAGKGEAPEGAVLRRTKQTEPANALEALARDITTQPKTFKEKLGSNLALQAEMNAADMRAGVRETLSFGDDNLFTQAMYHVRKAEQKMAQMFTVMNSGPLVSYKDEKGFVGYRSSNQNSARDVFDAIADIPADDPQLKTNIAQAYLVAIRANNKGLSKLDLGELGVTQEALDAALAAADADPALKAALENVRRKYNAYNKGLIEFLASTGRISKKMASDLLKDGDYVPYYRVRDNGMAELNFGNNVTFNVGDIRRQPYLAELKGGETKLLPLNEALQQNTLLLTDMALTNNAAKSVAYGLQALGKGMGPVDPKTGKPGNLMPIKTGPGPADARTIRFFQEPDASNPKDTGERHLIVNTKGTAAEGVPAELVVQSLEGASLALPGFLKLGGAAADLLRAGVTRTPLYIARKLIREPMAAAFTGGLNSNVFSAVFKAGAEFVRMSRGTSDAQVKLIEKGLIQSNIFAGDMSDMKKMALQLASGKDQSTFDKVLAAADRYAMRADAATLALVLKNAEENGLSEVEADMMTMESMNFYKRGLSPTLQYASRLIPFFNAQIQGLSVLIKAARGNMPFEEQQQIKRKFFNNAMLLMGTGIVYAMAMEDDETFRNARPRDKYSNFFLPIPFVDEPVKLPIPFEAGYFFSLAVAAVDGMRAETDGKAQFQALRDLFLGSVPGYSSMGVPQLVKPAFEVWADKNFLTGGPVEPRRLQGVNTEERYLATTTELAKQMSKAVPILSPIQIEHIVRGYLGVLPLVAAAGANSLFEGERKAEKPESRASDLPLIGTAFQKKYGGGDADVVYREAQESVEARNTLNKMLREGRREDAAAYREKNKTDLAMASAAGQYRQVVGRINEDIRRTQDRTDLTPQEKRIRLDALDKAKQERADAFIQMSRRMAERTS